MSHLSPFRLAIPIPHPSGDAALTYRSGAGFLPKPPNNEFPAAFKSLGDLLVYFEVTLHRAAPSKPYSLNGVHPSTAIFVSTSAHEGNVTVGPFGYSLLYTAPSAACHAWYYMVTNLKMTPGINTGPVVTGLKNAKYVAISAGNTKKESYCQWPLYCHPDWSMLTLL